MNDLLSKKVLSKFAFIAFFISLFLFFTPFEMSGSNPSMFPKYFISGASIFLIAPLMAINGIRPRVPSALVMVVLLTIIFHTIVVKPAPAQFLLLISADVSLAILMYEASFYWKREFESAVCWLLVVNIVAISVQMALFHLISHTIFDFHKLIFSSDARFAEDYLNIARFTGIQVEPGTYASYMGCLLAILVLSSNFSKKLLWISFFTIISIMITNSGSAIYFVLVLAALLGFLWRDKIRWSHVMVLFIGIVAYLHFSGLLTHMEERFLERDDGTLSFRVVGFNTYMAMSLEDKFIGIGFDSDPCAGCHYQDIGVTFNLLTRGGIIIAIALSILFFRLIIVNGILLSAIIFLVPLNEKMFFYEAPIWVFILFATSGYRNLRSWKAVGENTGSGAGAMLYRQWA
jgi:hypothetical protein